MKLLRLAWRNALRNRVRAVLTAGGAAFLTFVLVFMLNSLTAIEAWQGESDAHLRVAVMHNAGVTVPLKREIENYLSSEEIQRHAIPHVQKVVWFGGYWQDPKRVMTILAADLEQWPFLWSEVKIADDVVAAARSRKNACVAGKRLAERLGWKIGQEITIEGSPWGITPQLILVGYTTCNDLRNEEIVGFRWHYFDELMGFTGQVSYFWLKARTIADIPVLKELIDGRTRNSSDPTETMTEREFINRFLEMMGNLKALILNLGAIVLVILTLMTANTMSMAARERVVEIAMLRALGFGRAGIFGMMLAEAALLTLAGAAVAVGAALLIFNVLGRSPAPEFFPAFDVAAPTVGIALIAAAVSGLLSALFPAARSARRPIVDGLRQVV